MLIFCIYISVQNFSLKVELKACLKEYQFTIVNDCELHLHLTLVLSTALNKEHTMTIYVNLQNYLHTRFMKCYRWILFKAMTILGCCNFDLYPLGTLKFCFNFFEDIKKRKIQAKDFVYKIRWSMHCKVQFIKYIKIYMDIICEHKKILVRLQKSKKLRNVWGRKQNQLNFMLFLNSILIYLDRRQVRSGCSSRDPIFLHQNTW